MLMKLTFWVNFTFDKQLLNRFSFDKKLQTLSVSTQKLRKTLSYKKAAQTNLVKLTTSWRGQKETGNESLEDLSMTSMLLLRSVTLNRLPIVLAKDRFFCCCKNAFNFLNSWGSELQKSEEEKILTTTQFGITRTILTLASDPRELYKPCKGPLPSCFILFLFA